MKKKTEVKKVYVIEGTRACELHGAFATYVLENTLNQCRGGFALTLAPGCAGALLHTR